MLEGRKTFSNYTAIEVLDLLLKVIYEKDDAMEGISLIDISTHLLDKEYTQFAFNEILLVLEKLEKDGFIEGQNDHFTLSFDGRYFHEKKGYSQKEADERVRLSRKAIDEKILVWGASGAAIGAIGILLLELLKLIYHHWEAIADFFCPCH